MTPTCALRQWGAPLGGVVICAGRQTDLGGENDAKHDLLFDSPRGDAPELSEGANLRADEPNVARVLNK